VGTLSPLQRMLLACDGTLTDMVEAAFGEPLRLIKLGVETMPAAEPEPALEISPGDWIMRRRILLQGAVSKTNYVRAESLIALAALPAALREDLVSTDSPIGRLWALHKLETRKEILRVWRSAAGEEAEQLARTYRVFSGGRPIMFITEYFPVAETDRPPAWAR
jgi:chorismate-pyruvate lyase